MTKYDTLLQTCKKHAIHPINKSIIYDCVINQWRFYVKSYNELKAEMDAILQQIVKVKRNERVKTFNEAKQLYKEFSFTAGMQKGSLV